MMLELIDGETRQPFDDSDFPLAIGRSADGAILAGVAAEPNARAWLTYHEGRCSIQGEPERGPVFHNGVELSRPTWLRHGAQIAIDGIDIDVAVTDDRIALTVWRPAETPQGAVYILPPEDSHQAQNFGRRFRGKRRSWRERLELSRAGKLTVALFTLLGIGATYVFASSPVYIRVTPDPENLSLSGFPPPIPIGERYLALPGTYTVEANKAGFRGLRQRIAIYYDESAAFQFSLEKLPGVLSVTTTPIAGVQILVDGQEVGRSPVKGVEIAAGEREIRAVSERYLPETRKLDARGMGQEEALEFALKPGWGTLIVETAPDKARVALNGKDVGETPLHHEPLQGSYEIEVTKEGWKPIQRKVDIQVGATTTVPKIVLEKIDGTLEIDTSPTGATVAIGERFLGQTPLSFPLESDKEHEIKLTKQGYAETIYKARVDGAKTTTVAVNLAPEYGTIFLTTTPAGSTLTVNGKPAGSATQRLSLQTLPQTLEVTRAGYLPFKTTVSPRAGVVKKIEVTLKTASQALKDEAQKGIVTPGGQKMSLIFLNAPKTFTVGASRRDPGARSNEVQYSVELTRSFLMSEKEVTNREFRKFKPGHKSGAFQATSLDGDDQPAVNVSWEDAARYANWLSKQEKLEPAYKEDGGKVTPITPPTSGYRLPTEAEWEFVARYDGGQEPLDKPLRFPWGDEMPPPPNSGNYADDGPQRLPFAIAKYVDGFAAAAPVGKFPPNRSNVYDLGGNVAEWCHDYYDVPVAGPAPARDPSGPTQGRFHVIKGASWRSGSISELRLSYRDYAEKPRDDIGFRIVRYATPTKK